MNKKTHKFRVLYVDRGDGYEPTVAEIIKPYYVIMGNGSAMLLKDFRTDWGNTAKWGKYITIPPSP